MNWLKTKKKKQGTEELNKSLVQVLNNPALTSSKQGTPPPLRAFASLSSSNAVSPVPQDGNNALAMTDTFVQKQRTDKIIQEIEQQNAMNDVVAELEKQTTQKIFKESIDLNDTDRRPTHSFAQHLNQFVHNEAGDLDAVVEAMTSDVIPINETMDEDEVNDKMNVDDYSMGPKYRPKLFGKHRTESNYDDRVSIYQQRANIRRGTITKLKRELDEEEKLKIARLNAKSKTKAKKMKHEKTKSMNKPKKFKVRDQYLPPTNTALKMIKSENAIGNNENVINFAPNGNNNNQQINNINNHNNNNKETFNINININHSNTNLKSNKKQQKKTKHQRYASSSAVPEYYVDEDIDNVDFVNDDDDEMDDEWYQYLSQQHDELTQEITYFDVVINEIFTSNINDKYATERTLIEQMKFWIYRYGVPAMRAHTEIYQLKMDLVKINEEADQFEEEAVQLTQKVFNLENHIIELQTEKKALQKSHIIQMNELEEKYKELKEMNTNSPSPPLSTKSMDNIMPSKSNDNDNLNKPPPPPRRKSDNAVYSKDIVSAPPTHLKHSKSVAMIQNNVTDSYLNKPPPPSSSNNSSQRRSLSSRHKTPPPPDHRNSTLSAAPPPKKHSYSKTLTKDFFSDSTESNHNKPALPPRTQKTKQKSIMLTSIHFNNEYEALEYKFDKLSKINVSLEKEIIELKTNQNNNHNNNDGGSSSKRKSKKLNKDLTKVITQMSQEKYIWESEKEDLYQQINALKKRLSLIENQNKNDFKPLIPFNAVNVKIPPKPFSKRMEINAEVELNENEMNSLEYIDKEEEKNVDIDTQNMVEINAEIDEYENSDDAWVSDENEDEDNKEKEENVNNDENKINRPTALPILSLRPQTSNSSKPLLSQSNTETVVSPKISTPISFNKRPPSRPPPKGPSTRRRRKKTSAKITKVIVPRNQLKTRNITNNDKVQQNEESGGFNNLLAKFVNMEEKSNKKNVSSMTPTATASSNNMPNVPLQLITSRSVPTNADKRKSIKKAPPSRALPKRTIIANVKRVKQHYFKPKKHGFLCIVKSCLWDKKIVSKQPKFYVAIDGLPSTTNIDLSEPEWKKRKKNDILVPFLCFFKNKNFYDNLINETKNFNVRDVKFQKKFALCSNGMIRLDESDIDYKLQSILKKLNNNDNDKDVDDEKDDKCNLFIATDNNTNLHILATDDEKSRNEWFSVIQNMINKRKDSRVRRSVGGDINQNPTTGRYKMRLY